MVIVIGVVLVFLLCLAIKAFLNLREIKREFTCSNCGHTSDILESGLKCDKCHRTYAKTFKKWVFYFTATVVTLDTRHGRLKYSYKEVRKYFLREIVIISLCVIMLTVFLVIQLV